MNIEPIWADYATYDDEGFINGVTEDAPEEVKRAFYKYQEEKIKKESSKEPIFKY